MSGEQIYNQEHNMTPKASGQPARVNINVLLTKVREEKNKEKKENLIFVGLVCGVVAVTGIIASL